MMVVLVEERDVGGALSATRGSTWAVPEGPEGGLQAMEDTS